MSNVYTLYMSIEETQHALGIIERRHVLALLHAHRSQHHRTELRGELLFTEATRDGVLLSGALVRQLAECPECFPALTAARQPRTTHYVQMLVPDEVLFEEEPEEKPEEESSDGDVHPRA